MKRFIILVSTVVAIFLLVTPVVAFGQAPDKMTYQAVIRNNYNHLVVNTPVGLRITILQGSISGVEVYKEIHNPSPMTNDNGLVTLEIGGGVPVGGAFHAIDWSNGPFFLKTETDPTGGTNYSITGTSQLLSVPYALHAKTADSLTGGVTETDPHFNASVAAGITGVDTAKWNNKLEAVGGNINEILYWNGSSWVVLPPGTHGQTLTICNGILQWGSCVSLPTQPSSINGPPIGCVNTSGLIYNVTFEAGVTYTWTVPTGWLITSGQGSYQITVTAGTASGNISVTPSNTVGSGPAQTLAVSTVQTVPTTPTEGAHFADTTSIMWLWNPVAGATGYKWNNTTSYATAIDMGSSTHFHDTGLACGIAPCGLSYTRYIWAYNSCGVSAMLAVTHATTTCPLMPIVDVTNPTTGKIWMDRNLGAAQVANSSTDATSYGNLYQWGRFADGHHCRTSDTTTTLSTFDQPGHGNFILAPNSPYDWRSPPNTNLWQGLNGVNNPCPTGYRLPTEAELEAERLSWSSNNAAGAFASPLKLPLAGTRSGNNGSLAVVGSHGYYWSSTVISTSHKSLCLFFNSSDAWMLINARAYGASVRCLNDN